MDIEQAIKDLTSKADSLALADWIGEDHTRFTAFWKIVLGDEYPLSMRTAWTMDPAAEKYPALIDPLLIDFLDHLESTPIESIKRIILKMLNYVPSFPEEASGRLLDYCLTAIQSPETSVAVKAYSITHAFELSKPYPELLQELAYILETALPYESKAYVYRAKKALKMIDKLTRTS